VVKPLFTQKESFHSKNQYTLIFSDSRPLTLAAAADKYQPRLLSQLALRNKSNHSQMKKNEYR
jgi:hypothetical protein